MQINSMMWLDLCIVVYVHETTYPLKWVLEAYPWCSFPKRLFFLKWIVSPVLILVITHKHEKLSHMIKIDKCMRCQAMISFASLIRFKTWECSLQLKQTLMIRLWQLWMPKLTSGRCVEIEHAIEQTSNVLQSLCKIQVYLFINY